MYGVGHSGAMVIKMKFKFWVRDMAVDLFNHLFSHGLEIDADTCLGIFKNLGIGDDGLTEPFGISHLALIIRTVKT